MNLFELVANFSKAKEVKDTVEPIVEDMSQESKVNIFGSILYENIMKLDEDERIKVTARVITTMMELVYLEEKPWD